MRSNALASVLVLSALAPASPALASLSDFRLPGERSRSELPPPDLQGPVAPDVPASRRPPASATPSPAASTDPPAARETAAPPVELPSGLQATPVAPPSPRPTAAPPGAARAVAVPGAADPPQATAAQPADALSPVAPPVSRPGEPGAAPTPPAGRDWPWWPGALALLLAALGAAGWALRRRARRSAEPAAAPRVEQPRPALSPASPSPQPAERLQVSLEPLRLALTLMNATLAYRLELTNRGTTALSGVAIGADMISAHASLSREEQLSGPRSGNGSDPPPQRIERLEPGEKRVVEGEFRLPFPQIVPIRQGDAALLLPLARFRVVAEGAAPVVRTFVVGQPGQGKRLRPFRLDQGPRIYPHLAHHAFA
jgi:hypothetical protein